MMMPPQQELLMVLCDQTQKVISSPYNNCEGPVLLSRRDWLFSCMLAAEGEETFLLLSTCCCSLHLQILYNIIETILTFFVCQTSGILICLYL